jgi:hypothetical protein
LPRDEESEVNAAVPIPAEAREDTAAEETKNAAIPEVQPQPEENISSVEQVSAIERPAETTFEEPVAVRCAPFL